MKKGLIVFSFCLLFLITYSMPLKLESGCNDIKIDFYTKGKSQDNAVYLYDDIYMFSADYQTALQAKDQIQSVVGISATMQGDYDRFCEIIKKCNVAIKFVEDIENVHIIYGISESCGKTVQANGIAVNFQIAIRDNVITVGSPLIMGSY